MKVTNHTRASKKGKQIACPKCNSVATVYHFAWSSLGCQTCKEYIDKYDWEVKNMCQ